MPPKRKASASPPPPTFAVFRSAPVTDRLSTFVAHYSPTVSAKALQADSSFADASHRVAAWRIPSKQRVLSVPSRQLFDTGYDDDGEQYAGKRLEKLLDTMKVEGSVVVARWYGGVLLGPVRFTHIENVARDAILQSRNGGNAVPHKQQKFEEEDENEDEQLKKRKLESILEQRDNSIIMLRALLAEKKVESPSATQTASPMRQISYSKMSLNSLRKLEKARDATLAWLLNEIDKAELAFMASGSNKDELRPAEKHDSKEQKRVAETTPEPEARI